MSWRIIEIKEDEFEELGECVEKMLHTGGKLMSKIENMKRSHGRMNERGGMEDYRNGGYMGERGGHGYMNERDDNDDDDERYMNERRRYSRRRY